MKNTKIALSFLATYAILWIIVALVVSLVMDVEYRVAINHIGLTLFMCVFGWILPLIVASDVREHYYPEQD